MAWSEGTLVTELKWDVEAMFRRLRETGIWDKRHDASKKGKPDILIVWRGFTSFLEAKYVREGEGVLATILESPLQLATMTKLRASSGRAFYVVWVKERGQYRSEVWLPVLKDGRPHAIEVQRRDTHGTFGNGLFLERLQAQHSAGWQP